MVFSTGCEPDVDWSRCDESTGFHNVLPAFFIASAVVYGVTGVLYTISTVRTLRTQLREQKKLHYNTAVQMHAGIVTFSVATIIHGAALASRQPRIPPWPLLLLLHLRYIWVGYVTTVLVRHWAVLYQQMGKKHQKEEQLDERIARFVELYRDGEVAQAFVTFLFYFSTVTYGVSHQENWEQVERLQLLFWAIFSGITCWLVTILGQRVHANMKKVARSRAVLDYIRRVKYVVVGSSLLWCQCTVCFSMAAALTRPISARTWVVLHSGISLTGVGTGFLYYIVIGSKIASKAANAAAMEAARAPVEGARKGAHQVQAKIQALAQIVSSGATQLLEGVSTITSITSLGDASARVHVDGPDEEPGLYQRITSCSIMSARGRAGSGASRRRGVSAAGSEGGVGNRSAVGGRLAEEAEAGVGLDEEAGIINTVLDDKTGGRGKRDGADVPERDDRHGVGVESEEEAQIWETSVTVMSQDNSLSRGSSAGSHRQGDEQEDSKGSGEDPAAGSDNAEEFEGGRLGGKPEQRKRPSWNSLHRLSSNESDVSSRNSYDDEEGAWRIEDLDTQLLSNSGSDGSRDGSGLGGDHRNGSYASSHSEQGSAEEEEEHHHSSQSEESFSRRSDVSRSYDSDGSRSQLPSSSPRCSDSDSPRLRISSGDSSAGTL